MEEARKCMLFFILFRVDWDEAMTEYGITD